MGGGLESCCVGSVYGADGAARLTEWADGSFSLELFKRQMTVEGKTP